MLGQEVGSLSGQVTGQRVLPSDHGPKVETIFTISGETLGVDVTSRELLNQSRRPCSGRELRVPSG
jgi:hypothetical protein